MNREIQVWRNSKAILEDESSDPTLRDIADRIVRQHAVTAAEADQVFAWRPPVHIDGPSTPTELSGFVSATPAE